MTQPSRPLGRLMMQRWGWLSAGAVAAVSLPPVTALFWRAARSEDFPGATTQVFGFQVGPWTRVAVLVGWSILVWLAVWWTGRSLIDQLLRPVARLTLSAERYSEGHLRIREVNSGISELDRISGVMSRNAASFASSLATERQFASDASHQLRTPLTALLMRLEEIALTDDLAVVHEEAATAIAQVERLTNVVDELLMRSRGPVQQVGPVSLDSVLATLQQEWQPSFERARRTIRIEGERGLRVVGSTSALSQIFATLIDNSLAHGDGTVLIDARRVGPSVVVELTDEGPGVDPSLAPHIFERSVSTRGTGLGLALARDLAGAIGGRLELVRARPAVFAIFLAEATP